MIAKQKRLEFRHMVCAVHHATETAPSVERLVLKGSWVPVARASALDGKRAEREVRRASTICT